MPFFSRLFPLFAIGLVLTLSSCASQAGAGTPAPTSVAVGPKLAPPHPHTYVALGDSITYGMGAAPTSRGYAYLVARALRARHFRDTGIPGITLGAGYDIELGEALAARPSLCTVFFGYNDLAAHVSRKSFLSDLHDLIATLRQAGARVLLIGLPDLSLVPAAQGRFLRLQATLQSWNAGMRTVARQTGAHFLDLSQYSAELAAHPDYIASDGLHPSNRGHARLAQVVVAAIRSEKLWH